jgi:uncharacterized membrane protein
MLVRPRLALAAIGACLLYALLPEDWRCVTRWLVSWDAGLICYLGLAAVMMARSTHGNIRQRADTQDDGGLAILGFTTFGAVTSLVAIMTELSFAKTLQGPAQARLIGLAAATVFLSWIFMQTMFALHYAHQFYNRQKEEGGGGLEFPGKFMTPDYWDFVYFSFIIGTAAQTADINITSQVIRRIVTLQCLVVFFFNTTVLALAINVGASLL